jgi:UPF0176 protein
MSSVVTVAAFYKFVAVEDCAALKAQLHEHMRRREMRGTILIASEGINGTISAAPQVMVEFLAWLRSDARFADLATKEAQADGHPFKRTKVRLKREIISLRRPEADPTKCVGTYVEPRHWNKLVSDPDVVLVDTRNVYEVEAGTFRGARDPKTRSFGQFPDYVAEKLDPSRDKKIAMFCTGGIRCEKASALLLAQGFSEVYHLQGGILQYLKDVPAEESLFDGECFVFDERETVDSGDA